MIHKTSRRTGRVTATARRGTAQHSTGIASVFCVCLCLCRVVFLGSGGQEWLHHAGIQAELNKNRHHMYQITVQLLARFQNELHHNTHGRPAEKLITNYSTRLALSQNKYCNDRFPLSEGHAAAHAASVDDTAARHRSGVDTTEHKHQDLNEHEGSSHDADSNPSLGEIANDKLEPWVHYITRATQQAESRLGRDGFT